MYISFRISVIHIKRSLYIHLNLRIVHDFHTHSRFPVTKHNPHMLPHLNVLLSREVTHAGNMDTEKRVKDLTVILILVHNIHSHRSYAVFTTKLN